MEANIKKETKPSLSRLNIFETCFIDPKGLIKKKGKSIKHKKTTKTKKGNYLITERETNKRINSNSKQSRSTKELKSKYKRNSKNNNSGHNSPLIGIKAIKQRINKDYNNSPEKSPKKDIKPIKQRNLTTNNNTSPEKSPKKDIKSKKERTKKINNITTEKKSTIDIKSKKERIPEINNNNSPEKNLVSDLKPIKERISKSKKIKEQNVIIKSKFKTINEKVIEKNNNGKTIDVAVPKQKNKIKNNRTIMSPKRNEARKIRINNNLNKEISKNKSEPKMLLKKTIDSKKVKETISTNLDTISTEKSKKQKNTISPEKNSKQKILDLNNNNNDNNTDGDNKITFARIPRLIRRQTRVHTGTTFNAKDVEKAIKLRRLQYNEYLKSLNKPKPKLILKQETISESESEPEPEPIVYDSDKVNIIQKIFKGYHVKEVHQTVNRLRINSCLNELLCLISGKVYIHAKKRITFNLLKTYYHEPFIDICEEVGFKDKIAIKLSDRYYNFKNLVEYEYYEL